MSHWPELRRLFIAVAIFVFVAVQGSASSLHAQITPLGQRGCAQGTVVGGANLVFNGDFAIDPGPGPSVDPAAGFTSAIVNRGPNTHPSDGGGGGFSVQTGPQTYLGGLVVGKPFPGDLQRDVPATQTYFYSNPFWPDGVSEVLLWSQEVSVVGSTTYNFFAFFDNLIIPAFDNADPVIELRVDNVAAGPPVVVPESPDQWIPVQFAFTTAPNQTKVRLAIYDLAQDYVGDDFAMTQISLRQCVSGIGIAKLGTPLGANRDGSYGVEYLFTLRSYGVDPEPLRSVQVTDSLAQTFAGAADFKVASVTSPSLVVNPLYDGKSNLEILAAGNQLAAQQSATIRLRVDVWPGPGPGGAGPFANSAQVSARAGNLDVLDLSVSGTDPDPFGNGNPKEANEPTVLSLRSPVYLPLLTR